MFKPLISRLDDRHGFGSMVSPPNMPLPEILLPENARVPIHVQPVNPESPEQATTLSGFVLATLTGLHPDDDELKARRADLISEAAALLAECDALIFECQNEHRSNLEERREFIRAQGRAKLEDISKLEKALAQARQRWNTAIESKGERGADLEAAKQNQARLSQWATDREIMEAKTAVVAATEALKAAITEHNEAMQAYSAADSALASAQATLAEWGKEEQQLRLELAGVAHFDHEFGLATKAGI